MSPTADKLTPAMRQYKAFKAKYPDAVLFFRMGDFYELFWDDAKTAAKVLGLALTSRSKGPEAIPMAGVPFHAVESYLAKMIRAGHRVAICEQIENPAESKGLVKRDVVRLMTPGTLTDESILSDREANYLAAVVQTAAGRGDAETRRRRDKESASASIFASSRPRVPVSSSFALAWVELSTGRFFAGGASGLEEMLDELCRIRPAEVLLADEGIGGAGFQPASSGSQVGNLSHHISQLTGASITRRPPWVFERHTAIGKLTEHFGTTTLAGFGFEGEPPELLAAGAILDYLQETQKTTLDHIRRLTPHRGSRFLQIDATTLRALEVLTNMRDGGRSGSLLGTIDQTATPMGSRRLRQWLVYPLRDIGMIEARQDAIGWLLDRPDKLKALARLLDGVCDIERVVSRLAVNRGTPRDLLGLSRSLRQLPGIAGLIGSGQSDSDAEKRRRGDAEIGNEPPSSPRPGIAASELVDPPPAWLTSVAQNLSNMDDLADYLETAISPDAPAAVRDGGVIRDGFDGELDDLRRLAGGNRDWLATYQADLVRQTGVSSLRVGYNQVFGYYIEVSNAHSDKVPPEFVRRQTLKNAERYITEPLKNYETQVLSAESKSKALEARLFEQVRLAVTSRTDELQRVADGLADIDCIASLASTARSRGYVRPTVVEEPVLRIVDGRHPVLAETLAEGFVGNDAELRGATSLGMSGRGDTEAPGHGDDVSAGSAVSTSSRLRVAQSSPSLALITGPNMAGKSTYIRQVALLTLLAQTGSFLPAREATIGLADRIFTRVGAADELARGQSTFMVEMIETANILNNATEQSLVILDEVGRGTSTFDGVALAWAITEFLARTVRCRCLFATHYHELTELADLLDGVANFNVAVREWGEQIVFLHRIVPGGTDKSYGIHVARLAGVPAEVISRSRQILRELEGNFVREAHGEMLASRPVADPEIASRTCGIASRPAPSPSPAGGASGRGGLKPTFADAGGQMFLFGGQPHPLLDEIRKLSLDETPPIEALRLLQEFQTRLRKEVE